MNILLRSSVVFFCLISTVAFAQPVANFFPDQRVLYEAKNPDTAYRLATSALKKVNGVWGAEQETLVRGKWSSRTFEVGRPYELESARLHVQEKLEALQGRLLYSCEGLDCGSSNAWANERFQVEQLYGLDVSQSYQVWQFQKQGVQQFAVAYLVQRGNKRIYFQIDNVIPKDQTMRLVASANVLADKFYRDKFIELSGLEFSQGDIKINPTHISAYATAFNLQPFRKLVIVGHDYQAGKSDQQKARALRFAEAIADALEERGVKRSRITVESVGSLAPSRVKSVNARVVVLLR